MKQLFWYIFGVDVLLFQLSLIRSCPPFVDTFTTAKLIDQGCALPRRQICSRMFTDVWCTQVVNSSTWNGLCKRNEY